MSLAIVLLYALSAYAIVGLCTAVAFVTFGVTRVLPMTATIGARILLVPGAAALWPYVLLRWVQSRRPQ